MKKLNRHFLVFTFVTLIFIAFIIISFFSHHTDPMASKGTLDLSDYVFDADTMIPIYGEWELYFGQLLEPEFFLDADKQLPLYRLVPDRWDQSLNPNLNTHYFGTGYGTYHLKILIDSESTNIGLYLKSIATAYKLYINGSLAASCGTVGTSKQSSIPHLSPVVVPIVPANTEIDVVLQVSNYHYSRGGIWAPIHIGNYQRLQRAYEGQKLFATALCSAFFLIALISLLLYFFCGKRKPLIILSISSLLLVFLVSTVDSMLFYLLFPNIPIRIGVMLLYLSIIWVPYLLYFSLKQLFESILSWFDYLILFFASLASIPILVLPIEVFTHYALIYNIMSLPPIAGMLILIIKKLRQRVWESYYMLMGIMIMVPCMLLSALYHSCLLKALHFDANPIGLLSIIITEVVIIISRYERMYLETKKALVLANDREIARLNAQIKPHFLYNAINSIILRCHKEPQEAAGLLENLSVFLRSHFRFSEERQFISLEDELDSIRAYLSIESARFHKTINMTIVNNIKEALMIPALILQPLVENTIIHGFKSKPQGSITITANKKASCHEIIVCDDGIGMSPECIDDILNAHTKDALHNINQRLILLYQSPLEIMSSSQGTCITIAIPLHP